MATVKSNPPIISSNQHEQMLALTPEQMKVIRSKSKKKLITGPFGSGKSLVGRMILKNWFHELKGKNAPAVLCYISCNEWSLLDVYIRRSLESYHDDKIKFIIGTLHQLCGVYVPHRKQVIISYFFFCYF